MAETVFSSIKGMFGNTNRKDFASNGLLKRFRGISTGNRLTISDNTFYTIAKNTKILSFAEFPDLKAGNNVNYRNNMGDNLVTGNKIIGSNKLINTFVIPESTSRSNKIFNNISK